MSKELLQKVIDKGVEGYLNEFFQGVSNYYTELEDDLSEYDGDGFSDFQAIGEINFSPGEKLVVVTANIAGDLTERSGKKAQYEKAKKILKSYMRYDAGIFVFSDPAGNFRLSLIYGTPDVTRLVWSNFRRFTYFVSKDQTNKTFRIRVGGCKFLSLEAVKDAFSVEKVTKAFYTEIADWYFWAVQNVTFPKDAETEANGRNNAVIRLITRLIFIWFMKERKLVSPDLFNQEKISVLLKSLNPNEPTYYKAILQNLFFATLNTQIEERKFRFSQSYHGKNKGYMEHSIYRYEDYFKNQEDMLEIFRDIPFLNGGLFDCLDWSAKESGMDTEVRFDGFSDKEIGLNVPNYLFFSDEKEADLNTDYGTKNKKYRVQGLLNLLSAYNFTIDENDPNDQEVALDPELLGKVFENLLASFNPETATTARKATGSYYTPREIVDYMVTQSLKQYYKTHLSDVADIDNKLEELLSPITEEPVNPFGETDSKRVVRLTEELRIVDPAVGSGAFPMGILNKLVSVLARVDHNNRLWQDTQLKAVEAVTDQLLKQKLIKQINEQFTDKNSNYGRKLYLIQKCIYGVDIQQIAIEIAKLRFFIALLVDERIDKSKSNWGIEPLPNLDFKLMQGNSLISEFMGINLDSEDSNSYGKLMKDETDELITQYQNKKSEYQYEPDRAKKESLKNEIEELIARIFESKLQDQKAGYLTKLKQIETRYASIPDIEQRNEGIKKDTEILNKNYKFDLAQAEKQLKEFTSGQKVKPFFAWKLYFAEVFRAKDGFDIVIANPPYITISLGKKQKFFTRHEIDRLKNGYGNILEYKGNTFALFLVLATAISNKGGIVDFIVPNTLLLNSTFGAIRKYILKNSELKYLVNIRAKVFEEAEIGGNLIIIYQRLFNAKDDNNVHCREISKLCDFSNLGDYTIINQDMYHETESCKFITDYSNYSLINKIHEGSIPLRDIVDFYQGIITGNNKKYLASNKVSKNHEKILRGKDIHKYYFTFSNNYVLFDKKLLWSNTNESYFRTKEKLINRQTGDQLIAAYDNEGSFTLDSTHVQKLINTDFSLKYILSLFNSKLLNFVYTNAVQEQDRLFAQVKTVNLKKLPIKKISIESQYPFIVIVNKIINITKDLDYRSNPDKQAEVKELERQMDQMVYELYGLTPEERAVVEGNIDS